VVLKRFLVVQNKGGVDGKNEGAASINLDVEGVKLGIMICLKCYNNSLHYGENHLTQ